LGVGLIYRQGVERESDSSGGALLLLARGCPGPWKELVEAIVRPEIDEADENIGKIGLGLDVVQFAGLCQRRDDGPIFSTIIGAELIMPGF
jgi:hypothetical protein